MLVELAVHDLGIIREAEIVLGEGMTVLTGETGAGKTLIVDAIELLVGGRADPLKVRPGAEEARVQGRFVLRRAGTGSEEEVILTRVIPRDTRSRAYVDGRLATAAELGERGAGLADLHGQHAHQSLLSTAAQRQVLDRFGGVDLTPLQRARTRLVEIEAEIAALGGDSRSREREADLLRYQVEELERAGLGDPQEDLRLSEEEDRLAGALAHQEAAAVAVEALSGDGRGFDSVALAMAALAGRGPFAEQHRRLAAVLVDLEDLAGEVRRAGEAIEPDPRRLEEVRARRALLSELRRKYGETLDEVMGYLAEARGRLAALDQHDEHLVRLETARQEALAELAEAERAVGVARREAAPLLGAAVTERLAELAMERAEVVVSVEEEDPGDSVELRLLANPGSEPLPLARTASGGELARVMLGIRLVLTSGPPTLVFDEVDAGIGGVAATAVGRALAALSPFHQVLVVTHLPQVAAHADHHLSVAKRVTGSHTVASVEPLDREGRIRELARMLSGGSGGELALDHASELLEVAQRERAR